MARISAARIKKFLQRPSSSSFTRTMLLVLLPMTVLPVVLMGGSAYARARDLLRDQVSAQLDSLIHVEGNQIDSWVRRKHIRLGMAIARPRVIDELGYLLENPIAPAAIDPEVRESILGNLRYFTQLDGNLTFNEFLLVTNEGIILLSTRGEWEGENIFGAGFFRQLAGLDRSIAYYAPIPLYDDQLALMTAEPFIHENGQQLGTIIGIAESFNFLGLLETIPLAHSAASVYLISENNEFIGLDRFGNTLIKIEPRQEQVDTILPLRTEFIHEGDTRTEHAVVDSVNFEGEPVVASYTWLPSISTGIVVEVPQELIFSQLDSLGAFTLFLISGVVLLVIVITWLGARQLARPLLELSDTLTQFSAGDWEQRSAIERSDELGQLAGTFNRMADELTDLYQSLEEKVEARATQIRSAAEVAQIATSATELDELLRRTVNLIVQHFGYYHASVFLLDEMRVHANLRESTGEIGEEMKARGHSLPVGSTSIIGWVTANNEPRIASDVSEDPVHFNNELLPETRSEIGIPIAVGDHVLGALDVQSTDPDAFDPESVAALQILANQIAAAIQSVGQLESTVVDLQEMNMLYRAGRDIAKAEEEDRILHAVAEALAQSSYASAFYVAENDGFRLLATHSPRRETMQQMDEWIPVKPENLPFHKNLEIPIWIFDPANRSHIAMEFRQLTQKVGWKSVAYLPIEMAGDLTALIILGDKDPGVFSMASMQPYAGLVELASIALEKVNVRAAIQKRLAEVQTLSSVSQIISTETDFSNLYELIFSQIRNLMGEVGFLIALYDEQTDTVEVPFAYENGESFDIAPFPLGEGLTSIVIRTRQPLMITENTEARAVELGAKLQGKPARSWLGVPLIVADQIIGAISVQDSEEEQRFSQDDLRLMSTLAAQVAIVIRNTLLLGETKARAIQLEIAAEIARDVSQTLNLDILLRRAIELVKDRFGFYHASIFLVDRAGEHAYVRESTGDVGQQLKISGYKLAVGSQSIIGHVTAEKIPLVINDVGDDPIYRPHPLLPDTKAEVGIPIRMGDRMVGALDVQSAKRFTFTPEDVKVLQIIADQLAIAIVNAELFQETQENLAQHRLLHHVTSASASSSSLEEALNSAVQGLRATLDGDQVSIYLVDGEQKSLSLKASAGEPEAGSAFTSYDLGHGTVGWVGAQRQPLRIDNLETDHRFGSNGSMVRSCLVLPLIYRNELLGVLNVESPELAAYDDNTQEMIGTLCGTLAAIIANTRLIERQRLLFDVTSKIRRSVSMQNILETTVTELGTVLGVQRARIQVGLAAGAPQPTELPPVETKPLHLDDLPGFGSTEQEGRQDGS